MWIELSILGVSSSWPTTMSRTGSTTVFPLAWAALAQPLMKSCSSPRNSSGESLTLCLTRYPKGFLFVFFLTPTGSVEKSWGGKRSVKFPWAELLRQISPDESFISLWQATSLRHFLRSCRLPLSSSWLLDCVHPIPELQMKPFFRPAVPFVCVFAEVWCWTFQNGHSMPVCHRGSPPPWLCGCQFGSNAGETGVPGCTGQLWPQTHQYCQVSSVRSVTLTLTNL